MRCSVRASGGLGGGLKCDLEAKSGEFGDQALGLLFGRPAIEVVGAEVVVFGAVFRARLGIVLTTAVRARHIPAHNSAASSVTSSRNQV